MMGPIRKVEVRYRDLLAGVLQTDPYTGVCTFEYDKAWLASGFSLSPTELPLRVELFHASPDLFGGNFAIFEDSLPDGYGLFLLNRMLKEQGSSLKGLNPLQRLSIIGRSGMGALSYLPVMSGFGRQKELTDEESLDFLQEEALRVLSEKETADASLLYYNSANSGGARPKTALRSQDGSHWLVKFRQSFDPIDAGKMELLYMKTAREAGITIPRIGLLRDKYFAIERFDIDRSGQRFHVATAAALLKTDFRNQDVDYTNLLALTGYLTQDPLQVEQMYRRMLFNLVALNKDDHAKNFSFLCDGGTWRLAPAYDLTYSPQGSNGEHATSLYYNGNPQLDLVLKAGTGIRIPRTRCMEIIREVQQICQRSLPIVNPLIGGTDFPSQ